MAVRYQQSLGVKAASADEAEGDLRVLHRLRGRESNRRLPESLCAKVLKLVKAKYPDFGPMLACECLAKPQLYNRN